MAFPLDADLDIIVEVYLGADPTAFPEEWPAATDLSSRLLRKPIQIRRGRGTNQKTAQAGSCTLWLDNTDGALTPLLPTSTYYPDWDLGVPIRVSVDGVGEFPPYVRHTGFVVDVTAVMVPGVPGGGNISAVRVTSAGVLRRLTQGAVEKSGLRRLIEANDPYAYWALDDGPLSLSGHLTSGLGGDFNASLWFSGSVNPGSAEVAPWLGPGLELNGEDEIIIAEAVLIEAVGEDRLVLDATLLINEGATNEQLFTLLIGNMHTSADIPASNTQCWAIQCDMDAAGTMNVALIAAFGSPGSPSIVFSDTSTGLEIDTSVPHHLRIDLTQNGADIDAIGYLDGVDVASGSLAFTEISDFGLSIVRLSQDASTFADTGATVVFTDVALWVDVEPPAIATTASAALGFAGEQAHERFARNCDEEGISHSGSATESIECGPQPIGTVVAVLQDCETVDHGMMVEDFEWGLDYRASTQRENLDAALTVDLSTYRTTSGTQGDVLTPVRNDARLRNEWTITRPGGSSALAKDETHQAKRGRYNDAATVNVASDDQLDDEAQWRVREGTLDKLRYETLPLDIAANLGS